MSQDSTMAEALPRELAEQRFARLYSEHGREILGYALRRCSDPEDAADAVAETFLAAWRRLPDVPLGEEGRLWLYGAARLVVANLRRGERRRNRLAEQLRSELRDQIPFESAPDPTGIVEALTALEITPLAARSRLHRARRRLRAQLANEEAGSPETELQAKEAGR